MEPDKCAWRKERELSPKKSEKNTAKYLHNCSVLIILCTEPPIILFALKAQRRLT